MSVTIKDKSFGSFITEKIIDLSVSLNKQHILDEISIYGSSDNDGSATFTFEWIGNSSPSKMYEDIIELLYDIKNLIINTKKEAKEQESPSAIFFDGLVRILYRFRIWDIDGLYEYYDKTPLEN